MSSQENLAKRRIGPNHHIKGLSFHQSFHKCICLNCCWSPNLCFKLLVRSKTFLPAAWNFLLCVCLPLLKLLHVFHTIPLTLSHVYFSWSYTSSRLSARDVAPFPRLHLQQAERPKLACFLLSFSQFYQKITFVRQRLFTAYMWSLTWQV